MAISGIGSSTPTTQRPDPAKAASDLFAKIDTKDQGYIDKTELQTAFDQISGDGKGSASDVDNFLSQVDTDKDGKISKQELTDGFQKVSDQLNAQFDASRVGPPPGGAQPPSVDDIFSNLDTKNQGYLDKDELLAAFDKNSTDTAGNQAKVDQIFKSLDTDGDNKITKDELSAGMDKLASQNGAAGATQTANAPQQAGAAGHAHGAGGGGKSSDSDSSNKVYDAADTNQDGTVSLQELIAYQATQSTSGVGDTAQPDAQTSLDAVLKIADQLAQTYGQFDQSGNSTTTASNTISEVA